MRSAHSTRVGSLTGERLDELVHDGANRLKQRLADIAKRLPAARLPLFESYGRGDLDIYLDSGTEAKADASDPGIRLKLSAVRSVQGLPVPLEANRVKHLDAQQRVPVLVNADEPFEYPEGVTCRIYPIRTAVRLGCFNHPHRVEGGLARDAEVDFLA